ncbi:MAG: GcvT family protein, partial [Geminicoccaceae bacterium]
MVERARVVVIGGGAVGCSCLYHLAKAGWTDCLLLEQDELTSGSTWHAAGNCPTFSGSWNIIKYQRYSAELYENLAETVDYPINYHVTGSIRLAHTQERMDEFRHVYSMAEAQGLAYELMTPDAARESRYPFLELDDLKGALWDPMDGDIDPSQLTQALAKGARDLGAKVKRFTKVTGLEQKPDANWRILTDKGEIEAEIVVNAAGYRAGEVMAMLGRKMPIVTMSHQYLITEPIPELVARDGKLPLLRDPDISYYLREERDGLILGPYEWKATPMWTDGLPDDFANQLWEDDLDRIEWYIEQAIERVPLLGSIGVQRVINGPIPYSPDGNPYIGPAHGLKNFYQCCCFSFGIAQAGGAGKTLAEWVTEGEPEWDLWALDPRRYTGYATKTYVTEKAIELYQHEYGIGFPFEERPAGRPARTSPLYDRLKAKGARFGARGGWERAIYFAPDADGRDRARGSADEHRVDDDLTFRRDRNWFETVGEEVRAVREGVGILDLPGFSKFTIGGPGAEAWLDRLTCSKLPRFGRISLAYMLNDKGGVVSEYTVTRIGKDRFHLISAAAAEWHDEDWLAARLPDDGSVTLTKHHGQMGTLVLAGPKSRDVLGRLTDADLSSESFPWLSARPIEIGMAEVVALRVNYVGELGWELHAPAEDLISLYETLWQAGEPHGIRDFGMYAMESLRLDKCYRGWKSDLGSEYSPLMSSLDRFVDLDKDTFIGKEALQAERNAGVKERFVPLTLDQPGEADAPFCAPIRDNGEIVGLVTSGGWSYTLEKSIALGYVRADLARPGAKLDIDILGERCPATVGQEPLYDHNNSRL